MSEFIDLKSDDNVPVFEPEEDEVEEEVKEEEVVPEKKKKGRAPKYVFTEEELKHPIIQKYAQHRDKMASALRRKRKAEYSDKIDKLLRNEITDPMEVLKIKMYVRRNLFRKK